MRTIAAIPLIAGIAIFTASMHPSAVPTFSNPVTAAPVNHTLVLTANDYAYAGLPARVSAGWVTIRMINAGKELHMFASVSVPAGTTADGLLDSLMHGRTLKDLTEWGAPTPSRPAIRPRSLFSFQSANML